MKEEQTQGDAKEEKNDILRMANHYAETKYRKFNEYDRRLVQDVFVDIYTNYLQSLRDQLAAKEKYCKALATSLSDSLKSHRYAEIDSKETINGLRDQLKQREEEIEKLKQDFRKALGIKQGF